MAEDKTLNEINKRFGITGRKARDIAKKVNSVVASPKPATKKAAAKPKTIGSGPNKAKVAPMPPAKSNAKGLPKTGRQNMKKAGK